MTTSTSSGSYGKASSQDCSKLLVGIKLVGMKRIYLSLGSNVGDREDNLRAAIDALQSGGVRVLRTSPVYETEPVDYREQGWFLNLVAECETALTPSQKGQGRSSYSQSCAKKAERNCTVT